MEYFFSVPVRDSTADSEESTKLKNSTPIRKRSEYHDTVWADPIRDYTPASDTKGSFRLCLLEVFRVKINIKTYYPIDPKGLLSGAIMVEAGLSYVKIYNQLRQHIEKDGGDLLLTGPGLSFIVATDPAIIYLNLMISKNSSEEEESHLDDVIHHEFWSPAPYFTMSTDCLKSNKPMREVIDGCDGILTATLFYSVFTCATHAIVEVRLIDKRNSVVGLYGLIAASTDMIQEVPDNDDFESVFFVKELDESVEVRYQEPISLARSTIAVPLNSNLIVRAVLHNQKKRRTKSLYFRPTKISFPAKLHGVSEKAIYGKINVRVTWNSRR